VRNTIGHHHEWRPVCVDALFLAGCGGEVGEDVVEQLPAVVEATTTSSAVMRTPCSDCIRSTSPSARWLGKMPE
jgi:hypothetical protein